VNVLKFRIRYQDGRTEELAVEGDRVLIGSGAHCEIRLPVDQAAIEHVAVQTSAAGLTADALTFQPPPTLNGMPFSKTQLLPDAIIGIGQCQIRAVIAEQGAGTAVIQAKKQKTSPATLLLAAVAIPISLYVLMSDDGSTSTGPAPKDVPDLWGDAVKTCPQAGQQALVVAQEKRGLADTKRERRPFFVQDGVAAVPMYETAAACFAAGGDPGAAKEAGDAAVTLRKTVQEDYRTHRVRLEHALSVNDWATAHREATVLLAFTEGKQGDYVTWLANLERQLQLKYGKKR
jgi:hypothetical protein